MEARHGEPGVQVHGRLIVVPRGLAVPGVPGIARNARGLAALGLGDDVLAGVLAGNALTVYPRIRKHATDI